MKRLLNFSFFAIAIPIAVRILGIPIAGADRSIGYEGEAGWQVHCGAESALEGYR